VFNITSETHKLGHGIGYLAYVMVSLF